MSWPESDIEKKAGISVSVKSCSIRSRSHDRGRRYLSRWIEKQHILQDPKRWNTLISRSLWTTVVLCGLGATAIVIWLSLLLSLPRHNKPLAPSNGASAIVDAWCTPIDSARLLQPWRSDFSKGIKPLSCHSHNDYTRAVPLFDALAAGCMSVEADIWLPTRKDSDDLLVAHTNKSLSVDRTLGNLYIKPLTTILGNMNAGSSNESEWRGVYQSSTNTTLTFLLDFKSNGTELWPYVNEQLGVFRANKWLTSWNNSTGMTWGPIIIVASGHAPFDLITSNTTYRDIFYDAPLHDVSNPKYNTTNSYYASLNMARRFGKQWFWKFNTAQLDKISAQIKAATDKGLISRYWDTPKGPVRFREYVQGVLIEKGVGILNVDVFSSSFYYPLMTRFSQNRLSW